MAAFELYHDESMKDGYWHGMLLVPVEDKTALLEVLSRARENAEYTEPLSVKNIRCRNRVLSCAEAWIQIGFGFLRSRSKNIPYGVSLGRSKGKTITHLLGNEAIGAKFILFRERDNHQKMSGYVDTASKMETTMRFGIKGGLHCLGSNEEPIHIEKMHFDGHQHHLRHLDKTRIVGRLNGLRSYCTFSEQPDLIDDGSSDHRIPESQSYEDCQLLQLTDLLIGSFRVALGADTNDMHKSLAHLSKELLLDYQKGYARMRNSRWLHSFWLSECYLDEDGWRFENLDIVGTSQTEQMTLW